MTIPEINQNIINSIIPNTFDDRAFGCILGAFAGDACGSYLEFINYVASEEEMDECMKMPGGGPWNLSAGQITDDSELAMCLMWALTEINYNKG